MVMSKRNFNAILIWVLTGMLLAALFPVGCMQVGASEAAIPEISYIAEGVTQGSTVIVMGENLDKVTEVWLWQPGANTLPDEIDALKKADVNHMPELPSEPPAGAVMTDIIGEVSPHTLTAKQIGDTIATAIQTRPTVIWLKSPEGCSKPYMFNKPDLFFLSDPEILPGQKLRFFGRNLAINNSVSKQAYDYPVMFKKTGGGEVFWGEVLNTYHNPKVNMREYTLEVMTPKEMTPGNYEIYLHILNGGPSAWSNKLNVKVLEKRDFIGMMARPDDHTMVSPSQENVSTPKIITLNALKTDGFTDCTSQIQAAIDSLHKDNGGIVVLPGGNIAISKTLRIGENVILMGAGRGNTQLVVAPNRPLTGGFPFDTGKLFQPANLWIKGYAADYGPSIKDHAPMVRMGNKSGLMDLAVNVGVGAETAVLVGEEDPQKIVKDTFIKRTNIINRHTMTVFAESGFNPQFGGVHVVSSTEGFTMIDNEVTAYHPLYMLAGRYPHRYAHIEDCKFEGYPKNISNGVYINTMADSVFEDNEIAYACRGFGNQMGMWRNWLQGNSIHDIGGIPNASELMMSETGNLYRHGSILSSTDTVVNLDFGLDIPDNEIVNIGEELYAYVMTGRGMGQYRRVVGNTNRTVTVDRPWKVIPDSTSRIAVKRFSNRNLFVNNRLKDNRGDLQPFYGSAADNVIVGNECYNSGMLDLRGFSRPAEPNKPFSGSADPVIYNMVSANMMINSGCIDLWGQFVKSGMKLGDDMVFDNGNLYGNTVIRNQVWSRSVPIGGNQDWNIWWNPGSYNNASQAAIQVREGSYNVVEVNYIYNSDNGIMVQGGRGNVVRGNKLERVTGEKLILDRTAGTFIEDGPDKDSAVAPVEMSDVN